MLMQAAKDGSAMDINLLKGLGLGELDLADLQGGDAQALVEQMQATAEK